MFLFGFWLVLSRPGPDNAHLLPESKKLSESPIFTYNQSLIIGISALCCRAFSQSPSGSENERPQFSRPVQSELASSRSPFRRIGYPAGRWLEPVALYFRVVQWTGELSQRLHALFKCISGLSSSTRQGQSPAGSVGGGVSPAELLPLSLGARPSEKSRSEPEAELAELASC